MSDPAKFPASKVRIGRAVAVTCDECEVVIHWEWFLTPGEARERRAQHIADHRSGKIVASPDGGNTLRPEPEGN
jgi:hypothetical protein